MCARALIRAGLDHARHQPGAAGGAQRGSRATHTGQARTTVSVSVMDYLPTTQFASPNTYFAPIDDAIRGAAFRCVRQL
jgi:hypothetical protein